MVEKERHVLEDLRSSVEAAIPYCVEYHNLTLGYIGIDGITIDNKPAIVVHGNCGDKCYMCESLLDEISWNCGEITAGRGCD